MKPLSPASRPRNWPYFLSGDVLSLLLSLALALWLLAVFRHERIGGDFIHWWQVEGATQSLAFGMLAVYCCIRFWILGHYERRLPFWDELRAIVQVVAGAGLMNVMAVVLMHGSLSRFLWPVSWMLVLCTVPLLRGGVRAWLMRRGRWKLPTVILGCGPNALAAWRALHSETRLGFEVRHFIGLDASEPEPCLPARVQCLPAHELAAWLEDNRRPHLLIALEAEQMERHGALLEQLALRQRDVFLVPPLTGLPLVGLVPYHFFRQEVLMLGLHNNLSSFPRRVLKRGFDICGALSGLVLLAPLLLWLSLRIRRDGGPALFGQRRVGRRGHSFNCLKFRTMVADAPAALQRLLQSDAIAQQEWSETQKLRQDPRVTPLGDFLRRSSLDELPQLWNVLRGDMSLVGPRPVVEEELQRYGGRAGLYLQVRPGMTGLWQVSGRNDTTYEERVALDAWYIKNWSLWYDIAIVCKTVRVVLGGKGAY